MKKLSRYIYIFAAVLLVMGLFSVYGCSKPTQQTTVTSQPVYDSYGNLVEEKIVTNVDSRYWADSQLYAAQADCWKSQQQSAPVLPEGHLEDAPLIAAISALAESNRSLAKSLDPKTPCNFGVTSNEVDIVKFQESTKRQQFWGRTLLGLGAVWGISELAGGNGAPSIAINGDGNQVRGTNTGAHGNATYTEQTAPYGGIPLSETDINPINIDNPDSGESGGDPSLAEQCVEAGGVWVAEEQRCSDGSGGTIDL